MTREQLLDKLWETADLLDDSQLERATLELEKMASREREVHNDPANKAIETKSYIEFIDSLSAKLRTGDDMV